MLLSPTLTILIATIRIRRLHRLTGAHKPLAHISRHISSQSHSIRPPALSLLTQLLQTRPPRTRRTQPLLQRLQPHLRHITPRRTRSLHLSILLLHRLGRTTTTRRQPSPLRHHTRHTLPMPLLLLPTIHLITLTRHTNPRTLMKLTLLKRNPHILHQLPIIQRLHILLLPRQLTAQLRHRHPIHTPKISTHNRRN